MQEVSDRVHETGRVPSRSGESVSGATRNRRILIIGCGSIGRRHLVNLRQLNAGELFVFDKDHDLTEKLVQDFEGVHVYDLLSTHLDIDAFVICTYPASHMMFAKEAIKHKAHMFIEKPISHDMVDVEEVFKRAEEEGLKIQVGYQYRFSPMIIRVKEYIAEKQQIHRDFLAKKQGATKSGIDRLMSIHAEFGQYLPKWHPHEHYLDLYTSRKDLGGGIILDASHELDLVRYFADSEVKDVSCFAGTISDLTVFSEDTADILLRFHNGVVSNIHLDFTQQRYTREYKLIFTNGTLHMDLASGITFWDPGDEHNRFQIHFKTTGVNMYQQEMEHFLKVIDGEVEPYPGKEIGKAALKIAVAAKQSATERTVVTIE